jgi:hypothetical protein
MTKSNCFSGTQRFRPLWIASVLVVLWSLGFGFAWADSDSVNDSAKKVGNNFGELLKGMGQEVKKIGKSHDATTKKDKKKETNHPDKEPDKGKEKPN